MPPKFRKTYACFYDGQQEELYFKHFSKLIKDNFEGCSVDFKTISNFNALVKSSTGLPKIAVFDYDKNEEQFMKRAKEKNIETLYTNLNFDLWLLLHKKKYNKIVTNNDDYIEEIKKAYNLETKPDIKTDIKKKKIIGQILDKIDLNDVKQAIKNAKKIMESKLEADKIIVNKDFYYYNNPSMNIHEFFDKLLKEIELNNK